MVTALKTAIKTFIGTELGYPLDKIVDGKGFRTLQFVLLVCKITIRKRRFRVDPE